MGKNLWNNLLPPKAVAMQSTPQDGSDPEYDLHQNNDDVLMMQMQSMGLPAASAPMPMPMPQLDRQMMSQSVSTKIPMMPMSDPAHNYQNEFEDLYKTSIDDRKLMQQKLQSQLQNEQNNPPSWIEKADLKPMVAYADHILGSNIASAYTPPKDKEEYQAKLEKLQAAVMSGSNTLSDDELNYLKMKSSEAAKLSANETRKQMFGSLNDFRAQKLSQGDDRLAMAAGAKIEGDSMIKNLVERKQQLARDTHTLDSSTVITPQIFDELQKGVANAITGARSATVSDTAAMKVNTLDQDWARVKQRITSNPQDINNPELKKYIRDLLVRLDDAYNQNINERTTQLKSGSQFLSSAKAKAVVGSKIDALSGMGGPSDQQTKEFNGHTYKMQNNHWVMVK